MIIIITFTRCVRATVLGGKKKKMNKNLSALVLRGTPSRRTRTTIIPGDFFEERSSLSPSLRLSFSVVAAMTHIYEENESGGGGRVLGQIHYTLRCMCVIIALVASACTITVRRYHGPKTVTAARGRPK